MHDLNQGNMNYSKAESHLEMRLHRAFDLEPFEDGNKHVAEDVIREALQTTRRTAILEWLRTLVVDRGTSDPLFAASLLRCLSRESEFVGDAAWRSDFVRDALGLSDVQLRDAAMQAAENWGDSAMIVVLQEHTENIQWLDAYRKDVIADLNA